MIDLKLLRADPESMRDTLVRRYVDFDLDAFLALDERHRMMKSQIDEKKHEQSQASDRDSARALKEEIRTLEEAYKTLSDEHTRLWKELPNFLDPDTPMGPDEESNEVIRTVGEPRVFDFAIKDHEEIGVARGWIDKEAAAKVSGSRFAYLYGELVMLQRALSNYVFDILTSREALRAIIDHAGIDASDAPFIPVNPPIIVNQETLDKMGRLHPTEQRYMLHDQGQVLIGSAEHSLGPIPMDRIFEESELPLRYVAETPAFRGEAGTYGKDMRGILRMHQFDKIEMEIFSAPEDAEQEHALCIAIQEHVTASLGIPYRLVRNASGDAGSMDYRQYDIEVWLP